MSACLDPIRLDSCQPLREVVCEALRSAIRAGRLEPGQRIMETELAEQLGVSRTPVREAIRRLELEGYVVMIPRRGTYVASLSIRDVNEVFEVRTALESLAAGLAADRVTAEEMDALRALLVRMGQCLRSRDLDETVRADSAFHDIIYRASRNSRLVQIVSNLREQLTRLRAMSMSVPGRLAATLEEHRAIVDRLEAGDASGAREAAVAHMERTERTLLEAMRITQGTEVDA